MRLIDLFEATEEENWSAHNKALEDTGFWGDAGAGALFMAKDTGRILFAHRSANVEQPNTWGTWGGAIDQGEQPLQAVKREAQEEAGVDVSDEDIIALYVFKHESGFQYFNYLILVDNEFTPRLDWETQGHEWVEFGNWPTPLHFGAKDLFADSKSFETIKGLAEKKKLKEAFKQESQSGIENEKYLVNKINKFLRQESSLTIKFHDYRTVYTVNDVKRAIHTGSQNRPGIKSDMDLINVNGERKIFSIKTERGNQWESADSYFGAKAKRIITKLLADGEIVLRDRSDPSRIYTSLNNKPGVVYDINPIAIRASKVEQEKVIFGDDIIMPDGCVIINTFNNSDFVLKDSILHINVKRIVIELVDLDEEIWFLVRKDKTRNPKDFIKGLRIVAVSNSLVGRKLRVGANGKVLRRY